MLTFLQDNFWQLLIIINYFLVVITVFSIVLNNLNPTKTLSYLLLLITLPYVGLLIYYFFGQEYRKNKIFKRKNVMNQKRIKKWQREIQLSKNRIETIKDEEVKEEIKLIKLLYKNQEVAPLTEHNKLTVLINGDAKYKSLFKDIAQAQRTVHLEYYIIKDDEIGTKLIDLLCEKASRGVEVRISYDSVGSRLSGKTKRKLRKSQVECYPFMPVHFSKLTSKINYRDHRKIAVIDGKIGYVGGINISDTYLGKEGFWRDTHLRIEGEAVNSLQLYFMLNWDFVTDYDVVIEDHFFPETEVKEKTAVQIAASGPDTDWANIMEVIFTAITTAEKYVYISTPYFIPNDEIIMALTAAAKSGVKVKLIIPRGSDSWAAKYATYSFIDLLLKAGVEVYFYTRGFIHAKVMIVDDIFTTIGTSNMDYRSFNINFEINALVYNEEIAKIVRNSFEEDLKGSKQIKAEDWENRKLIQKLKESFCRLWAPLL